MTSKEFIEKVDKYNREEIRKNNSDIEPLYDISLREGKRLAELYGADEDIVLISVALMDAKLPEAVCKDKRKEHTKMALEVARNLLSEVDFSEEQKQNILKCIEEHHGTSNYYSIESKVCATADCYKFASPEGILTYLSILARRVNAIEKEWEQSEKKMDEKFSYIPLEKEKRELEPYYMHFKELLAKAKEPKNRK